jgi:DNA-binding phage protein
MAKTRTRPRRAATRTARVSEKDPLREVILARINDLGVSRYAVANAAGLGVSHQTVYKYLSGRQDARSTTVVAIMAVLDLRVIAGDKPKIAKDPNG